MKEREPKIKVTNETKLYLKSYLKELEEKQATRKAKRASKPNYVETVVIKKPKPKKNPYQKRIDNLIKIERLLKEQLSDRSTEKIIDTKESTRLHSATRYIETAVTLLRTINED